MEYNEVQIVEQKPSSTKKSGGILTWVKTTAVLDLRKESKDK